MNGDFSFFIKCLSLKKVGGVATRRERYGDEYSFVFFEVYHIFVSFRAALFPLPPLPPPTNQNFYKVRKASKYYIILCKKQQLANSRFNNRAISRIYNSLLAVDFNYATDAVSQLNI